MKTKITINVNLFKKAYIIFIVKISYKTADGAISGDLTVTKDVIMFNPDLTGENNLKITSGNFLKPNLFSIA